MKRLSLLAISLIALTGCSSQKTADTPSSSPSGQPIEIKAGQDGWTNLGSYVKFQFGNIRAWKYKGLEVARFFIPSRFKDGASVMAGATTIVKSIKQENTGMPFIAFSCSDKIWKYGTGKLINEFTESSKETSRILLKVNDKYTGRKVYQRPPFPTTGYDPSKGWANGFVGKSGHGITNFTKDNASRIAALIANSKSSELVVGDKDKSIYFKFSFQTEPAKLVDDLCAFAMDGKVILPAVAETK